VIASIDRVEDLVTLLRARTAERLERLLVIRDIRRGRSLAMMSDELFRNASPADRSDVRKERAHEGLC
jgi:hypothetical protein